MNKLNDWEATGARIGDLGRSTVFHLWRSGELPSVKIRGRRFSTDRQIDAYIEGLEKSAGVA